jgi:hypothetical protein
MNRRAMVILPRVALGVSRAFSQTQAAGSSAGSGTVSHKAIARYSSLKSFYTIPKSEAKQAKYVGFLATLLSLTPGQAAEAARIFATAGTSHAEVKISLKTARQTLGQAVKNNDGGGISRASAMIGRLASEQHSLGANAQAAFYQLLTGDQQAKFNQFRG